MCSDNDGTVTITLTNTGTEAVVFQVTNPITSVVTDVTVGAGGSVPVSFGGFSDGVHRDDHRRWPGLQPDLQRQL